MAGLGWAAVEGNVGVANFFSATLSIRWAVVVRRPAYKLMADVMKHPFYNEA